jgi:predicted ATPase/class 3 adenylate cyclase
MAAESGAGPRGTVTFLFTDMEGSTRLLQRLGAAFPAVLEQHRSILRSVFDEYGGRVVDTAGDGFFVVFDRARDGVAAAVATQRALGAHPWPDNVEPRVRMGLHTGEPVISGSAYIGIDVHRAARIASAAHGGQVVLSEATRQLASGDLPADVVLQDLGEHRLKDLERPERLYQVAAHDLPASFPPLRTLARAMPRNLPARPARLVGREHELERIVALLQRDDVRLLTLTGPGGTGKTSLSVEAAARAFQGFPDGVSWVPLASVGEATLVPSAIAQTLGITSSSGKPLIEVAIEHLHALDLLLVLDNFEHLLDAVPDLALLIAQCPGITLLVTSRFALHLSAEHEFPVAPLLTPDVRREMSVATLRAFPALELFAQRASAVKPDFQLDDETTVAVAEICQRVDGLPLAIELAAARVKILSPRALLARLDRRLELLSGGARDLPARHRTLRQAIGWSYDLLDPAEQAVFRRLAVFAGACSLDMADPVCAAAGPPALPAFEGVTALVDKSLLRQDPGEDGEPRFVMLDTVREFALEQLEAAGEAEQTRAAHAEMFIALIESAGPHLTGPSQAHWVDLLDREHDNLRAAFDWALRSNATSQALRLGAALTRFWIIRGFHNEGRTRLRAALALPHDTADEAVRTRVLSGIAILAFEQSDLGEANTYLEQVLAFHRSMGDDRGVAETLNHMGWVAAQAGDPDRAEALSEEARTLHTEAGNTRGIALSLTNLGFATQTRGNLRGAIARYEASLELRRQLGETRSLAYGMLGLAFGLAPFGELERAQRLCDEASRLLRQIGDNQLLAFSCTIMGEIALEAGDASAAIPLFEEARRKGREIGQWFTVGHASANLAEARARLGQTERARQEAREALEFHVNSEMLYLAAVIEQRVGEALRILGDLAAGAESCRRALRLAIPRHLRTVILDCMAGLAAIASAEGRPDEAARLLGAHEALRVSLDHRTSPHRGPDLVEVTRQTRAALGEDAFQRAFTEGTATPPDRFTSREQRPDAAGSGHTRTAHDPLT